VGTPDGRRYRYRYSTSQRPQEEWVAVPVPDSGIPREWVDAAREKIKHNRRPSNAGRRYWDLSGGILRCGECGRAMAAQTCPKPSQGRIYFYYRCPAAAYDRGRGICGAVKNHRAEELEARVWDVVARLLKEPERLRAGLDSLIERERGASAGDLEAETKVWLDKLAEVRRKRARYQQMAAEALISFDELRTRIAELEETRTLAERELRSLQQRREHVQRLEQDRESLLSRYANLVPSDLDGLDAAQRHQVYKMLRVEAAVGPDGSLEVRGDVISVSEEEILSV
jgi:site-specific DNA recombinase